MLKFKLLSIILFFCTSLNTQAEILTHSKWDALLKQHVVVIDGGTSTQVDYKGMLKDRVKLNHYLARLQNTTKPDFDSWSNQDQLAFLINAYNAWTVELILGKYPDIKSIKDIGSFFSSPWKQDFIKLFGKNVSLDHIEHKLIRGSDRYNDPRIHFAVNCASIGCPALGAEAYKGEILDQQLDNATKSFLKDRSRNRLIADELEISSIFKWYSEDFEKGWQGAESLQAFLILYADALALDKSAQKALLNDDIDIDYLDYDWRLNSKRP